MARLDHTAMDGSEPMKFDLLIFDWDGTLANSAGHIVSTMQDAIAALGLPPRQDQQIAELIGLGIVDGMRRLYPEIPTGRLLAQLTQHRRERRLGHLVAPLFAGVAPALRTLHGGGFRLAVATGMQRAGLDLALSTHADIAPLIELSRTADETADKPNPLMLERILSATGIAPTRALMIGDTEYDMAMASAIGMPALGVACGVHDPGRLRSAGARAVIEGAAALPRWLER
jgi:phosphoglycolate phosphatase